MDAKTRQEHRVLNGKIFETGDWAYFPPVGFNCRCRARVIPKSKAVSLKPTTVNDLEKSQLKNADFIENKNTAFARWVAEKKKGLPEPVKEAIDNRERKLVAELGFAPKDFIQKQYLKFSTDPNYIEVASSKETFVFQHINADKIDLKGNIDVAKILNENTYSVVINEDVRLTNGRSNPEYTIFDKDGNTFVSDRKNPTKPRGVRGRFEAARNQGLSHLVVVIEDSWADTAVADGIKSGFQFNAAIQICIVVRGRLTIEVTRSSYDAGIILETIQPLY